MSTSLTVHLCSNCNYVMTAGDWIPISERLPEEDGIVLIHAESADKKHPLITMAWFDPRKNPSSTDPNDSAWSLISPYWIPAITHWMPLPKPPK